MKRIFVEILGVRVSVLPIEGDPVRTGSRKDHLELLLRSVAGAHGFTLAEVLRKNSRRELVDVRRRFAILARSHKYSLTEIGETIHKHHTTILHLLTGK